MSRIHVLPPELADKIAAGEVVERPASLVKELVENSLDAGSTHIAVAIQKAGKQKIQVSDNGCGMTLEEAKLALQRHATSKIQKLADLFAIQTLGFRGEALPAIASVSKLVLETKPNGEAVVEGGRVEVHGGNLIVARVSGCPVGTQVEVSDLFYNTPARQKFLKSDGVEAGHIEDTLIRLALGKLDCGFDYRVDGQVKLSLPVVKDPLLRLKNTLGSSFVEDCFWIQEETPEFKLSGWLVHPRLSAANANSIYFYLNGRFLRDRVLQHALGEGYGDFLMRGQYPKALLYLEMPPQFFDVNVHPAKREVRFVKSQAIHQFVVQAVRKAVQKVVYAASTPQVQVPGTFLQNNERVCNPLDDGDSPAEETVPFKKVPGTWTDAFASSAVGFPFRQLRILGAIASTYILCESPDGKLVLIDQHAAHERIGYEKLKRGPKEKETASQHLAFPLTWETGMKETALLQAYLPALREAGLEIEPFGGESFAIKTCPTLIPEKNIPKLLEQIVVELEDLEVTSALEEVRDQIFKTMACHDQVRAHDKLSQEEMEHLLKEMDEYHATHCPHGRPTTVEISLAEIEKWFKRF